MLNSTLKALIAETVLCSFNTEYTEDNTHLFTPPVPVFTPQNTPATSIAHSIRTAIFVAQILIGTDFVSGQLLFTEGHNVLFIVKSTVIVLSLNEQLT